MPADREITESPLSLDAIIGVFRNFELSKRIPFNSGFQSNRSTSEIQEFCTLEFAHKVSEFD
jgi:hypothetical protein